MSHGLLVMCPQRGQPLPLPARASPRPATLPWPKIANIPAIKGCLRPVDLSLLRSKIADQSLSGRQTQRPCNSTPGNSACFTPSGDEASVAAADFGDYCRVIELTSQPALRRFSENGPTNCATLADLLPRRRRNQGNALLPARQVPAEVRFNRIDRSPRSWSRSWPSLLHH